MCAETSRPVVRAATGFQADEYWGQLRQKGHQVMPRQALAHDDLSLLIHAHRVKHALGNVDPKYAHRWFHEIRLLRLYGCTDCALMVAHRSRSAQGAGPFHYDQTGVRVLRRVPRASEDNPFCVPLAAPDDLLACKVSTRQDSQGIACESFRVELRLNLGLQR